MYIPWGIRTLLYCCACFLIAPPLFLGFSHSSVGKESTCNAGDPSLIPELGRSAGEGIGYLLPYSWTSLVAQLVKKSACNAGDLGSVPGLGRSLGEGKGYPPQYSGLENAMDCIGVPWGHKELHMTEQLFRIPSLMSSCLNLPFGNQGKSRSLNEDIFYKLETD